MRLGITSYPDSQFRHLLPPSLTSTTSSQRSNSSSSGSTSSTTSTSTSTATSRMSISFLRRTSSSTSPRPPPSSSTSTIFPSFLTPSIPFRRRSRHSSSATDSSCESTTPSSTSSTESTSSFLSGHTSHLHCLKCGTDLCLTSQIISKGFTGRHGRAYLVQGQPSHTLLAKPRRKPPKSSKSSSTPSPSSSSSISGTSPISLPNTIQNKPVPRHLVTGHHTVSDISCAVCGSVLGWKYVAAQEESQRYKVGKFILETKRIRLAVGWEGQGVGQAGDLGEGEGNDGGEDDEWEEEGGYRYGEDGNGDEDGDAVVHFDSQDEDECEDLFAGVWSPELVMKRRRRGRRLVRTAVGAGGGISGLGGGPAAGGSGGGASTSGGGTGGTGGVSARAGEAVSENSGRARG